MNKYRDKIIRLRYDKSDENGLVRSTWVLSSVGLVRSVVNLTTYTAEIKRHDGVCIKRLNGNNLKDIKRKCRKFIEELGEPFVPVIINSKKIFG